MREIKENSLSALAESIREGLLGCAMPPQSKKNIPCLSRIASTIAINRTVNTTILSECLPSSTDDKESKYKCISRFLNNKDVDCDGIMAGIINKAFQQEPQNNEKVILSIDQTAVGDGFALIIVSMRLGGRAIPIAWRAAETKGNIGFGVQEELVSAIKANIRFPNEVILMGDRFYGTHSMIDLCKSFGWDFRLRFKQNTRIIYKGKRMSLGEAYSIGLRYMKNVAFDGANTTCNIGIVHEDGHDEPWIIAMSDVPSDLTILEYGKRWSAESMHSDFKSRGFSFDKTQLKSTSRICRLLLCISVALCYAVSVGISVEQERLHCLLIQKQCNKKPDTVIEKKRPFAPSALFSPLD